MRLLPALLVLLSACSSSGLGEATVEGQPTAATEGGLSLSVVSIDLDGDRTTVELVAVNGDDRPATLSRRYSPMMLTDASGQELPAAEQEIEVPAYSSDRLRVEFAGRPQGERMTLRAGDLTLSDLPTGATRFETSAARTVGDLSGTQANHANGSSVRVTSVAFGARDVEVQVEAVNGHGAEIELSASSSDAARLTDETGREYPLVPPASNSDLAIPQGQVLRGTLRFAGRVPAEVQRLTLRFNAQYGGDQDFSRNPTFSLDLPLASPSE